MSMIQQKKFRGAKMKILFAKRHVWADVFTGDGWENWTRFLIVNKRPVYEKGKKLSNHQLKEVEHVVNHS